MTQTLTQKVAHNTIVQVIGRVISVFFGLWTLSLITKYLGPGDFGYLTMITAFLQIFVILVDLGLSWAAFQFLSRPEADQSKIVNNLFTLRFFSGLIFIVFASIAILFFPYPKIVKIGVLIYSFSFFLHLSLQIFITFFQKTFQTIKIIIGEVAGKILTVIFILMVVKLNLGFFSLLAAMILGSAMNFILVFSFIQKIIRIKFLFDFPFWREILKFTWPIAISIAFHLVYFKADTIILSLYHSPVAVGFYGAPYRFLEVLIMFPPLFLGLIQPFLVKSWLSQNLEDLRRFLQKSFDFLILLTWPMIFGTLILAEKIMIFVSGPEFLLSGEILRILILATAAIFLGSIFSNAVVAINKQKTMLWFRLGAAVFSLTAYFLFIPSYSYFAAAWITVLVELAVSLIAFFIVKKAIGFKLNYRLTFRSFLAALLMSLVVLLFLKIHLLLVIFLGALVYFACLYFSKTISSQTLREILKI